MICWKCDRCHAIKDGTPNDWIDGRALPHTGSDNKTYYLHLCNDCWQQFDKWMREYDPPPNAN